MNMDSDALELLEYLKKNIRVKDFPELKDCFEDMLIRIIMKDSEIRAEVDEDEYDEDDALEEIVDAITDELSLDDETSVALAALADEYFALLD